jgi:pimeloyl-ACP methyl ester carboxylesterase
VAKGRPFRRGKFEELPQAPRRPHRYHDSPAREVRVRSAPFGDVTVHYREVGDGPPLLLIHGLMTTSYSWRYVLDDLARDHRVIAPDLPGCGRSDKPRVRYGAAALASFLLELSAALDVRGCAVVGNSMGGYLCMRAALLDEGLFARVCNIHSPGPPGLRYRALATVLALPGAEALLTWLVRRAPQRWAHRNVHYYDESLKSLEEAAEYGDPLATPDGAHAFVRFLTDTFAPAELRAFVTELARRRDAGQRFPVPLLLMYSRTDPLVPPQNGDTLHRLVPDSELVWLADTSHFAHVDTPDQVLAPLRAFLAAGASAAPTATAAS